jgi:hypothetical protein
MQQPGPDFRALSTVLENAKNIVCFIHPQATYDAVAAALAVQLAGTESGRSVEIVCQEPMRVEYTHLVGIDRVQQSVGNRDLIVSFAYNEDQVDKVSYNVDDANQRFELVISPKSGAKTLDPSTIEFRRAGMSADIVLLFGYHALEELGEMYTKEKYTIDSAFTVAITQSTIPAFAKLHLTLQEEQLSYSEMVYFMIRQLQIAEIKDDIATNLLSGMEYATERFLSPNLSPRTFETVANLMRRGAQRYSDNPAFQYLSMPIRQDGEAFSSASQAQPVRRPEPGLAPGHQGVFSGTQIQEDKGRKVSSKPVSPSEFAQAMGSRT